MVLSCNDKLNKISIAQTRNQDEQSELKIKKNQEKKLLYNLVDSSSSTGRNEKKIGVRWCSESPGKKRKLHSTW